MTLALHYISFSLSVKLNFHQIFDFGCVKLQRSAYNFVDSYFKSHVSEIAKVSSSGILA